ncbi:MAG: HNH endonuclease [Nitrosomonadaceae bacterium]|nr:HNH endonuclease [Nitrosomonadaceae bacterium]
MPENYQRKPNCVCLVCTKPVYRRPKVLLKTNGKVYCGQTCYGKACRKEVPCKVCGKPICATKHAQTCSRSCANKNRTGIKYDRGGARPKKDKIKMGRELKERLLLDRGRKCERCQYDNVNVLQGHHIVEKANGGTDDIENLLLLCPNCHYTIHLGDSRINNGEVAEPG